MPALWAGADDRRDHAAHVHVRVSKSAIVTKGKYGLEGNGERGPELPSIRCIIGHAAAGYEERSVGLTVNSPAPIIVSGDIIQDNVTVRGCKKAITGVMVEGVDAGQSEAAVAQAHTAAQKAIIE